MSSVKKAKKNKSELENKNPPKILKTEVKKTMSKSSSINTEDKKITNEPIEKEMLKGQEHDNHIQEKQENENNENEFKNIENNNNEEININNNDEQNTPINENINEKININEEKKENQIIQIKPRESYLKEKMMKLNYSEKLLTNINKNLDTEIQKIHEEIIDDQILITAVNRKFIKKNQIQLVVIQILSIKKIYMKNRI